MYTGKSDLAANVIATVHASTILHAQDDESRHLQLEAFINDLRQVARAMRGVRLRTARGRDCASAVFCLAIPPNPDSHAEKDVSGDLLDDNSEFQLKARHVRADGATREQLLFPCFHQNRPHMGGHYQYMDDLIRDSARCLAWRLHCVPRGGRANSPVACVRGDLSHPAFCNGRADRMRATSRQREVISPKSL
jgi:hypothetical protein